VPADPSSEVAVAYAVVVVAGGRSRRFGSDKLTVLLDRTLGSLPDDADVVCVGPQRRVGRRGVQWCVEEPAGGGPLAAVAAGVAATEAPVVVLVGGDMPLVGRAVAALVAAARTAPPQVSAAVLVDAAGRDQPLASAWRRPALLARLAELTTQAPLAGRPLRLLLDEVAGVRVPDAWDAAHDVDVPSDLPADDPTADGPRP
jgi:molybdopterin-guanine dinucleotide biosynthesis protein A